MSNERKPGYYWAKAKNEEKEVVRFFDHAGGGFFKKMNVSFAYFESDFEWISPQTIEDEILGLKYKADTLSDMLADNEKRMKVMEAELKMGKDENR